MSTKFRCIHVNERKLLGSSKSNSELQYSAHTHMHIELKMRLVFRRFVCFVLFVFLLILALYVLFHGSALQANRMPDTFLEERQTRKSQSAPLPIAVVACGQKLQETLVMIKSALLFHHKSEKQLLKFVIFAEDHLIENFREKFSDWRQIIEFEYILLPLSFPDHNIEWRRLFKPCAAQRLFLPSLLTTIDALLYVDTDVVFLSPVTDTWKFFSRFNATQLAALVPEHEDENTGWYNRFARHPYYGRLGVNSGVMLMNLTRMREFDWESHVLRIYKEYKLRITWGDQDIINIIFYYYPEKLFVMPCEYNYRPDHCMYMSVCNASVEGIKVLHGNRGYFHSDKQPLFKAVHEAIESYQLGTPAYSNFLLPLQESLEDHSVATSNCGKMSKESLLRAKQLFINDYSYNS